MPVLDVEDEILFQIRDYKDANKKNHDNMIGEFKIQLKDLMSKYGSIQEHEIIYYMGPAKKRVVAGILQLLPVFVDDFKKADEEYD